MSGSSSTWQSQSGYVWSLIGSAVGFGNILSFSAHVYKNGGGAFLIPYMLAVLVLGIPMLLLEGYIGHKTQLPLVSAYGQQWNKIGKVLGWLSILACLTIGGFYIVLTGYSVAYTYFAAVDQIPEDSKSFFLHSFLKVSNGLHDFGHLSIPIFISTLVVGAATWFVLVRNVKDGIERICSFFMPLLVAIILVFAIVVCFLPGGMNGWIYYLKPNFSKLWEPSLWRDIFGQLFFSLSIGLGIVVGYSRHTSQTTNITQAMIWVAIGDFFVSFIAGFAIFGCLAHISYVQQVPFDSVLITDSTFEIGFVLFPKLFKFFGPIFSQIIGPIFFFCIFIAGITGVFSIVESIAGNVEIEFNMTRRRAVTIIVTALVGLGALFCMGNASYVIDALAPMVLGINMLVSGLALIIAFVYGYGAQQQAKLWTQQEDRHFFIFALKYVAPILLTVILITNLWQEIQGFELAYAVRWSWLGIALTISAFLSFYTKQTKRSVTVIV